MRQDGQLKQLRQPRTLPAAGRPFRTTDRDHSILETLVKLRFATTSHVAALHFEDSRWAAQKRLRKLVDSKLVRAWVRDLSKENVYSLTRSSAKWLHDDGVRPIAPRGLDGNLDHLLAINGVRISLALHAPLAGGEIAWWRSDWELRAHARERVIPDAVFAVSWDGGEAQSFALEVDNRTHSARRFITKILGYRSLMVRGGDLYGLRRFVTLVVGRDRRWLERYRLAVGHAGLGLEIVFATLDAAHQAGVTGSVWMPAWSDQRYSLRDLTSPPYGNEGSELKDSLFSEA